MKKNMKYIVAFVLGFTLAGLVSVKAITYDAKQVGYTPKDSTWTGIDNVYDALVDLKSHC